MSKTTISTLLTKIKRRADYDIVDENTDNLLIDMLNDSIKRVKGLLLDRGLFRDISKNGTLTTIASQAYVDLDVAGITDLDEIISMPDRTADRTIQYIPYEKFISMYPDPTAYTTSTPVNAAMFNNRIYFGPTPSEILTLYFDYIQTFADVTTVSSLPFESKYDPVLIAMVVSEFTEWIDKSNSTAISIAKLREKELIHEFFFRATNIGQINASGSRRDDQVIDPTKPGDPTVGYGYGFGSYGGGAYGA